MSRIFVSYRRQDTPQLFAGKFAYALRERVGKKAVFLDVENIKGGENFTKKIEKEIRSSKFFIPIIGKSWLHLTDEDTGEERLWQERDLVRREIEIALESKRTIIPVLPEGAPVPTADDLPETIRPLANLDMERISAHDKFTPEVDRFVNTHKLKSWSHRLVPNRAMRGVVKAVLLLILAFLVVGWLIRLSDSLTLKPATYGLHQELGLVQSCGRPALGSQVGSEVRVGVGELR